MMGKQWVSSKKMVYRKIARECAVLEKAKQTSGWHAMLQAREQAREEVDCLLSLNRVLGDRSMSSWGWSCGAIVRAIASLHWQRVGRWVVRAWRWGLQLCDWAGCAPIRCRCILIWRDVAVVACMR